MDLRVRGAQSLAGPQFGRDQPLSELKNPSIFSLDVVDENEMNNLVDNTIIDFDEGDMVNGTVVKIGHDEVLLDIGYKSEGVIPDRELSIRKDEAEKVEVEPE